MPALASDLRKQLESVCVQARDMAEAAARSALKKRAVDAAEPFSHFTAKERELRNRLRARGRQAGDIRKSTKSQEIVQLAQELAYEYWHRMLFARLLAENNLLMHPDGVAVSLEECEELAKAEGASNGFVLAARYASKMLPQIFRSDDVLLEIEFAPEYRLALEKLLASLPRQTFLADDSLGWVYQFWQSKRKDEVNKGGEKIDGRTLPAVTQLFTEDYMVQFLLHNTIGAWWCGQHGIKGPPGGAGIPTDKAAVEMPYLRWRDDGTPAAGTFDGWPKTFAKFKALDPCCGSGHFLVAAFSLLVPLRMHDEGLSALEACNAVLRENLYGLEIDPRCTQIAAFALAVAAWKYLGEDGQPLGHRELPPLNVACTGIGPQASEEEWLKLAEQSGLKMTALSREPILNGLRNLHALFSNAPTLGSLIDPNQMSADLISADYETLQPYLAAALTAEELDDDVHERAVAAAGMVKAAELLAAEYTLLITNVPYLGRGKQVDTLKEYLDTHYPDGKADLATAFVLRCLEFCAKDTTTALVTPQNWLFLTSYTKLRESLLKNRKWNVFVRLGPGAFETIGGHVVNVALLSLSATHPGEGTAMTGIDVSGAKQPSEKATALRDYPIAVLEQYRQLESPDARIVLSFRDQATLLEDVASALAGINTGDYPRFGRNFVEFDKPGVDWEFQQSTTDETQIFAGASQLVKWCGGTGEFRAYVESLDGRLGGSWKRGVEVWGKYGIAVCQMSSLPVSIYVGTAFDSNVCAVVPNDPSLLPALWCYCSSPLFAEEIRALDQKMNVTNATIAKVPFDLARWQQTAVEQYPDGLPEPESDEPTQWLFHGWPESSTDPLHVSVARLLGYRWPAELDVEIRLSRRARELVGRSNELLKLADADGIVPIPAVRTESAAVERVEEMLRATYGERWSSGALHELLVSAGCKPGDTLDDWLRNQFFEQQSKMFQNRPFIWHVWDGRKDGFACLVNYHKLNYKTLENLTYSYLGDWIKAQNAETKAARTGADLRLAAAQALQAKLKLILAGEPPYDIFVRWKPLAEQAIGWHPDLNDGVRMNIRPFVEAGILRKNPNIKWTKDRGKDPERDRDEFPWFWNGKSFSGDRVNDIHLTNAEKQAARKQAVS